jgi:hypothetical protein
VIKPPMRTETVQPHSGSVKISKAAIDGVVTTPK